MVRRIASALFMAVLPLAAQAGDPLSYSFVEGQYLNSVFTPDTRTNIDDEYEGWHAAANVSLYKFIYFTGEADKRRAQKYRFGTQSVGVGAHTDNRMSKYVQIFGDATYERTVVNDVTGSAADDDDEGYGVQTGVRAPLGSFEFSAAYRYMNYGETSNLKVTAGKYGAGAVMHLSPYFALTADATRMERSYKSTLPAGGSLKSRFDEWTVGFRAEFATDIDRYRRRGGIFSSGE